MMSIMDQHGGPQLGEELAELLEDWRLPMGTLFEIVETPHRKKDAIGHIVQKKRVQDLSGASENAKAFGFDIT